MTACAARRVAALLVFGLTAGTDPAAAAAQATGPGFVPVDTAGLATGPYASMHMRLERTIFQVDVLTLDLVFGPEARAAIRSAALAATDGGGGDEWADAVARAAVDATNVWARIHFLRDVSLDQFVEAARSNLGAAREAGLITTETYRIVARSLPSWFAFLADRPVRRGDEMHYRIRGDTLRTVFIGSDGQVLLDQTDIGRERTRSVLGGYFAPGSDFREPLLDSLAEDGG